MIFSFIFRILFLALLFSAASTSAVTPKSDNSIQLESVNYRNVITSYPEDGVELGQGWDIVHGVKTNNICVVGKHSTIKSDSSYSIYKLVFDAEQVRYERNVSASASYGGFGYSAYLNTALSNKNFNDRSKTYIFSQILSDKGGEFLVGDSETKLSTTLSKLRVEDCGDGYVSAIKKGGNLSVIFEVNSNLQDISKILQINAGASGYGASLNLSFNESMFNKITNEKTTVTNIQQAGDQSIPLDVAQVKEKIKNFPNLPIEKAVPYQIVITPYSKLFYQRLEQRKIISSYEVAYQRLIQLYNIYNDALLVPSKYYTPFQPDNDVSTKNQEQDPGENNVTAQAVTQKTRLIDDMLLLKRATFCMKVILDNCSFNNKLCPGTIDDASFVNLVRENCELSDPYSENKNYYKDASVSLVLNSNVFLSENVMKAFHEALMNKKSENEVLSKELQEYDTAMIYAPRKTSSINEERKLKFSDYNFEGKEGEKLKSSNMLISPFAIYYKMLARSPLLRNTVFIDGNEKLSNGDTLVLAKDYCKSIHANAECDFNFETILSVDSEREKSKNVVRDWVLNIVLAPFSKSFCDISLQHPFCANAVELAYFLPDLNNMYMTSASGFSYTKSPVSVSPEKRRPSRPPIERPPRRPPPI